MFSLRPCCFLCHFPPLSNDMQLSLIGDSNAVLTHMLGRPQRKRCSFTLNSVMSEVTKLHCGSIALLAMCVCARANAGLVLRQRWCFTYERS